MSNEIKYQIFISSTYTDLVEARNATINSVLESYNFPVGMEHFGADNDEQWLIIKDLIDFSDFYILILGHRYGSISKTDGISFTEKEFDYAVERGVKLLCFVRNDNVATLPQERDEDPDKKASLAKFRAKVLENRLCEFWDKVDDLKHKISNSLYKNIRRHGGVGWVRGNQASGFLAEEIAKLSEENRKLREENESLRKSSIIPKPQLKIYLNGISCDSSSEKITIKFPILPDSKKFVFPSKRIKSELNHHLGNLGNFITVESNIFGGKNPEYYYNTYNAELDAITEKEVSAHNQSMQLLEQLKVGLFGLNIKIENIGTAISNNISVEIESPDFVKVIDDDSKYNIKLFEKNFSENIIKIETPENRSVRSMHHNIMEVSPILLNHNFNYQTGIADQIFVDDSDTIHLNVKSMLHSKCEVFRNFHLFPVKYGNGVLKIKVICAEYTHPEVFEIPIIVE